MTVPKVSILWLNYNSSRIINIVLESLRSIADLDYPNDRYELVVVDNGSTDVSFNIIKSFLEKKSSLRKKIIKLDRNLGFTGGCNVAFAARDPESKYIALLNNDAIPTKNSILDLTEHAEQHDDAGAIQGIILDIEGRRIDSAGIILNELLLGGLLFQGEAYQSISKPFYVTYADGAYSLLKVEAVKRASGFIDKLFYDEMFGYFDDSVLGLQMWDAGYRVLSYPIVTARHNRSATFGRTTPLKIYLTTRGYYALNELCNSKYKDLIRMSMYMRLMRVLITSILTRTFLSYRYRKLPASTDLIHVMTKGYIHGVRWGRAKLRERKKPINIYRAPLFSLSPLEIQMLITGFGYDYGRRAFTILINKILINKRFRHMISKYVVE